jgi:hypothetical protein
LGTKCLEEFELKREGEIGNNDLESVLLTKYYYRNQTKSGEVIIAHKTFI